MYNYDAESQQMREKRLRQQEQAANDDDFSMMGSVLGALVCILLFFLILFSLSYPYTMKGGERPVQFTEDKWWCYHCGDNCGSRCW